MALQNDELLHRAWQAHQKSFEPFPETGTLTEQCDVYLKHLKLCIEKAHFAANAQAEKPAKRLQLVEELLKQLRLRLQIWRSDCLVTENGLSAISVEKEPGLQKLLLESLKVSEEQCETIADGIDEICQITLPMGRWRNRSSGWKESVIDEAEKHIYDAANTLRSLLRRLNELQTAIQMAQAVHLGIGHYAELRKQIAKHTEDEATRPASSDGSAAPTEYSNSDPSDYEKCPSCGKWFPYNALPSHMDVHQEEELELNAPSPTEPTPQSMGEEQASRNERPQRAKLAHEARSTVKSMAAEASQVRKLAAPTGPNSAQELAIRDFNVVLSICTRQSISGGRYVLVEKLTNWLKSEVRSATGVFQVGRLLMTIYHNRTQDDLPVSLNQFCSGDNCCLIVLCILLELGSGDLVDRFYKSGIVDKRLPIHLAELQDRLGMMGLDNAEELAMSFDKIQWRFCAAKFNLYESQRHAKNRVVPICEKELISSEAGNSREWRIVVEEEFVGSKLRDAVPTARFKNEGFGDGPCYEFMLKSFEERCRSAFAREIDQYHSLHDCEGIVRYLADYSETETSRFSAQSETDLKSTEGEDIKATFNILLEYGELDLEEYFQARVPPVLQTEVEEFWRNLFGIVEAVRQIHQVRRFHGEIKLDTILSMQGKFKLRSLGIQEDLLKADEWQDEIIHRDLITYGMVLDAPEVSAETYFGGPASGLSDIWSLGCVFSVAATWVVLGYQGIRQFDTLRQTAVNEIRSQTDINREEESHVSSRLHPLRIKQGDCFHNGREVLSDIQSWHDVLRSGLRSTDAMTGQILDLIDQKMLRGTIKDRIGSEALCSELWGILDWSHRKPRQILPERIINIFLIDDEEDPSEIGSSITARNTSSSSTKSHSLPPNQKALGSAVPGRPREWARAGLLKQALTRSDPSRRPWESISDTTGRSGTLPISRRPSHDSGLDKSLSAPSLHDSGYGGSEYAPSAYESIRASSSSIISFPGAPIEGESYDTSITSFTSTLASSEAARKSNRYQAENVFQARAAIEKNRQANFLFRRKRSRVDELLNFYCRRRNTIFLVDNAQSMEDYWDEATFLLETLVEKMRGLNQDGFGFDLLFTVGEVMIRGKASSKVFKKAMDDPKTRPRRGYHTDMRNSLRGIFSEYLRSQKEPENMKNTTVIILTDGLWEGMADQNAVERQMSNFIIELRGKLSYSSLSLFSIQFIQFGTNMNATSRFHRLGDKWKYRGKSYTNVDHEPSSGDVNKMLMGSLFDPIEFS